MFCKDIEDRIKMESQNNDENNIELHNILAMQLASTSMQLFQTNIQQNSTSNTIPWMILPQNIQQNILNQNILSMQQDSSQQSCDISNAENQSVVHNIPNNLNNFSIQSTIKSELPKPPKKPLNTYMMFSKAIWPQVKAANSHLSSVTEIGAIVGAIWRDLDITQKQQYNDIFMKDKERYDNELRAYLKQTGLHASDLNKAQKSKKCSKPVSSQINWTNQNNTNNSTLPISNTAACSPGEDMQQGNGGTLVPSPESQMNIDGNNLVNILALYPQLLPGLLNIAQSSDGNMGNNEQLLTWLLQNPKLSNPTGDNILQNLKLLNQSGFDLSNLFEGQEQMDGQSAAFLQHLSLLLKQENQDNKINIGDAIQTPSQEDILECELLQLKQALSEKTAEVELLSGRLEEARRIIHQFQQQIQNIHVTAAAAANVHKNLAENT